MKIDLLVNLLKKYFTYTGIAHKFENDGMFSDINLHDELAKLQGQYDEDEAFRQLIDYVQKWDGEFTNIYMWDSALSDLTRKLIKKNLSQGVIIDKWNQYCKLRSEEEHDIQNGFCAGLSYTSSFEYFLKNLTVLHSEQSPVFKLANFEKLIEKICQWDGNSIDSSIQECFEILEAFALPLQENQRARFKALNGMISEKALPQPVMSISFVHNTETLKHKFKSILRPGVLIYFSASRHAARAFVTDDGKIIYYNPNERFGYLQFDLDHLEYFLEKIPQGFNGCYVDRFGLTSDVYCLDHAYDLDFEKIFRELIEIAQGGKKELREVVNATDSQSKTALYLSCYSNNTEEVSLLMSEMPVYQNMGDVDGFAPLHYDAMRNHADVAALLLTDEHKRARLNSKSVEKKSKDHSIKSATPLHCAAYHDSNEFAELLIKCPEVKLNEPDGERGMTALQIAASRGNTVFVKLLLAQKDRLELDLVSNEADPKYPKGMTALCYAIENDEYEIASELFNAGADISFLPMSYRWLLLHNVICSDVTDYQETFKCIDEKIQAGELSIDPDDECFMNFLQYIIIHDDAELLSKLIAAKPAITEVMFSSDDEDEEEQASTSMKKSKPLCCTPLQMAVVNGSVRAAGVLISADQGLLHKKDNYNGSVQSYLKMAEKNKDKLQELIFGELDPKSSRSLRTDPIKVSEMSMFKPVDKDTVVRSSLETAMPDSVPDSNDHITKYEESTAYRYSSKWTCTLI